MEVTKTNFKEVLPFVQQAIKECEFMSIDTELTGLSTQQKDHAFDTMEERYCKMYEGCKNFLIIQYGLSCFQYHKDTNKYTHKDFNFYVFPRPHNRQAPDPFFTCQPSSLHFLTSNGFDFNKLVTEGISYLTPEQEETLRASLLSKHEEEKKAFTPEKSNKSKKEQKPLPIPDDHLEFIKGIHKQIASYIECDTKETLHLPPCSSYRRKLIYQSLGRMHPTGLDLCTQQNDKNESYIAVTKLTNQEKIEKMRLRQATDMDDLNVAVGFRKVVEFITKSQKLVIGHNMLLDIFHTVNQFYSPLSLHLHEFKEMTRCVLPRVIDTKILASQPTVKDSFGSTALPEVARLLLDGDFPSPDIESAEGAQCYNVDMNKIHEAGFDAFLTGVCYVKLISRLGNSTTHIPIDSDVITPFINRLFVMRHFDIQSINLRGPDPEPSRDHVFFVCFPIDWRTSDLVELFQPYGNIYVSWLNDTSALVALKSPEQHINVRRSLVKETGHGYVIQSYSDYQKSHSMFRNPRAIDVRTYPIQVSDPDLPNKRRRSSSGSIEGSVTNRSITPIPEEDEMENNGADKQDNCVSTSHDATPSNDSTPSCANHTNSHKAKKQKVAHDDSGTNEVSSTEKMFEEPDW